MRKLAAQVTRIYGLARTLRRDQTTTEKQLWARLRSGQLPTFKFRRQFPIGDYIADFCCKESRLVVELDGVLEQILVELEKPLPSLPWSGSNWRRTSFVRHTR